MDKNHSEIDLFEQYAQGSMDQELKEVFNKKLSSDRDFAARYEAYKVLTDGIRYSGRKKLFQKMVSWDRQLTDFPKESSNAKNRYIYWYYAAAVMGFFVVATFVIYLYSHRGYDNIVAQYYQPYDYIPETTRGEKIDENSIWTIFDYYDRGEYVQTIQLITKLDDSLRTEATDFVLANAYQAMTKYDEAILIYGKIAESTGVYSTGAKWYLALCYLSMNNPSMARPRLEELEKTKTSYAPKAKLLLGELN